MDMEQGEFQSKFKIIAFFVCYSFNYWIKGNIQIMCFDRFVNRQREKALGPPGSADGRQRLREEAFQPSRAFGASGEAEETRDVCSSRVRPVSLLRLSLPRFLGSNFPDNSLGHEHSTP